jgi:hypothetical protein
MWRVDCLTYVIWVLPAVIQAVTIALLWYRRQTEAPHRGIVLPDCVRSRHTFRLSLQEDRVSPPSFVQRRSEDQIAAGVAAVVGIEPDEYDDLDDDPGSLDLVATLS